MFRVIPAKILTAEELGLSPFILKLCKLNKGLVLVTGPTGSGKSTTLCAMIDYINRTRTDHIITIEDPIEFVHENKGCLINQREVGTHTKGFKDALRAAMREDPDIILVGELRDLETVAIAIETAETGHLVFGTLHTTTAASTVDRVIDQFPTDQQAQIRIMLSESLKGVIAQNLCRKIGGGRVAALEVLLINSAISNLIREAKTFQIPSMMQVGRAQGMVALNDALMEHGDEETRGAGRGVSKGRRQGGIRGAIEARQYRHEIRCRRGNLTLNAQFNSCASTSRVAPCRRATRQSIPGSPACSRKRRTRDQGSILMWRTSGSRAGQFEKNNPIYSRVRMHEMLVAVTPVTLQGEPPARPYANWSFVPVIVTPCPPRL